MTDWTQVLFGILMVAAGINGIGFCLRSAGKL
jgi:hypothetical protein